MRKLWDFKCPEGHVTEHFVDEQDLHARCECGADATRIISPTNFSLPKNDPGFPGAYSKWIREHERAGGK